MELRIKPKFGRVLIKREVKTKTEGGIYIPDAAAKRNAALEGVIVALGETAGWTETYEDVSHLRTDGVKVFDTTPIQTLKVGDKVIFGRHAGAWLDATYNPKGEQNDDGSLFICQDQDILAVVEAA